MAHVDREPAAGLLFELACEGLVDRLVELAGRVVGYVEQLDGTALRLLPRFG